MPLNTLTTDVGLKVGPVLLETLVKHYLERLKKNSSHDPASTQLKHDELLYHEVFNVVKVRLNSSLSAPFQTFFGGFQSFMKAASS